MAAAAYLYSAEPLAEEDREQLILAHLPQVRLIARKIHEQERRVVHYCQSPEFNIEQLQSIVASNPCGVSSEDISKIKEDSKPN